MAWGALAGLGSGLSQVGGMLQDMNKDQMREKLARQREDRAEDRQVARENRQRQAELARVKETRINPDTGVRELVNANGDVIRTEQATAYELEALQLGRDKDRASLQKILADAELRSAQAAGEGTKQSLQNRLLEARIGTEGARAGSYNRANRDTGAGGSGEPATREAAIEALVQSVKGQLSGANMSEAEAYQYAETAIVQAERQRRAGRSIDPKRLLSTIIFNNRRPDEDEED